MITRRAFHLGTAALLLATSWAGPVFARTPMLPPGVSVAEETPTGLILDVRLPEVRLDPEAGWPGVEIPGYGLAWRKGLPGLPRAVVRLAVPATGSLALSTEVLEERRLDGGGVAAVPSLVRLTDPEDPAGPGTLLVREAALPADLALPYPGEVATLRGRGRLRDLPVAEIVLTPVRLLDRDGTLAVADRFRVRLEWSAPVASGTKPEPRGESPFDAIYDAAVANPAVGRTLLSAPSEAPSLEVEAGTATAAVLRPAVPVAPVPGSQVYRLDVEEDGVYRLSGAWLAANAPDLLTRPVDRLFVAGNGVEIPIRVVDDGDGVVSAGDAVVFFGEMVDEDPLDPDLWQRGDYTDTRPYYLGVSEGARLRMSTAVSGAPASGYPVATTFTATIHAEKNDLFLNNISTDADDRWYDAPFLIHSDPTRDFALPSPEVDTGGQASLRVRMLGQIIGGNLDGYHRTRLLVNGGAVDEADWDGAIVFTQGVDSGTIDFPANVLTGTTTVRVELPLDRMVDGNPITTDLIAANWVELDYPRLFQAVDDRLLLTVPNQDVEITVTGLAGNDAAAYDVTPSAGGLASPWHLAGAVIAGTGPHTLTFELAAADGTGAERTVAISAVNGLIPVAVSVHQGEDLAAGGADWLLIGPEALLDTAPASALSDLVALRQAQGLQTRVVILEDVYAQFSFGLKDPQALRDFIGWALVNWAPAPTFVVLVGDASFDAKNNYGHASPRDLLPTYMVSNVISPVLTYYSADNDFAAVLGPDNLPDVLLGRLPAHHQAEAETVFGKLVAYEALSPGPAWTRRAFFMSDEEGGGFESAMRQAIGNYFDRPANPGLFDPNGPCFSSGTCFNDPSGPGPIFSTASLQALIARNPSTLVSVLAKTMKQWIKDGIDAGDAVSYFIGHGGFQEWGRTTIFRGRSFAPDDVDALNNGAAPTFLININCITGGFHGDSPPGASVDRVYSLGEDFLLTGNRGAIGVLAPTHLTFISILAPTTNAIWDRLLGEERDRLLGGLNLAVRLSFDALGDTTDLRSFAFLADPATRLILPDPERPGSVQALAGNGVVDLSWTPGADAVTFRVERSSSGPGGPYAAVSPPGHAAASFSDVSVANGTTYHYKVYGVDGEGMESVPSNRNLDCPGGPGCVSATPLNPNPPATPTGFAVADTGGGGRLEMAWDANPETDLAFYRVRYGTTPGSHPWEQTFGPLSTGDVLRDLENDVPVFLVLEAVNTSGLTSPQTAEREATPRLILGVTPPRAITDLRVDRDLSDTVLSWSRVTEDIYGRPGTVEEYRVYSSAVSPLYPTDEGHRLGTVPDGPAPEFRHGGGATGTEARYYLVVSRDPGGFDSASALGLPAGVSGLAVDWAEPGTLRLTWPAVTTDTGGEPLAVDHYVVYGSATPFSRADISFMTPIRAAVHSTSVDVLESEGDYFSVLAVDARGDVSPY